MRRIGCQVQAFWPLSPELPPGIDVVFLAVLPGIAVPDWALYRSPESPIVIAIVTYENPTVIDAVLKIGAEGLIASPVRSFGLLSALVLARQLAQRVRSLARQTRRLEQKLEGIRKTSEAKSILMQTRGLNEVDAFRLMREQAMAKRVTIEEIADAIVNANEILSYK
ncbi:MAG TPA: ANTAR domain-containing protein [Rhodocyclaceae bacterium]|nr:ANTAR domain-containing protein [Rhodocyclaceae bacterium]